MPNNGPVDYAVLESTVVHLPRGSDVERFLGTGRVVTAAAPNSLRIKKS